MPKKTESEAFKQIGQRARVAFGENFRRMRVKAGLTQADVARRVGTKQGYISDVEQGLTNVSIDRMAIMADVVGAPLYQLLMPPLAMG